MKIQNMSDLSIRFSSIVKVPLVKINLYEKKRLRSPTLWTSCFSQKYRQWHKIQTYNFLYFEKASNYHLYPPNFSEI